MQKQLNLRLTVTESGDPVAIKHAIAATAGCKLPDVTGYNLLRQSIDARGKAIRINLVVQAFIGEPFVQPAPQHFTFRDVRHADKRVVIIGTGPAGLFAALRLTELGIRPVLLERGKDVRSRRRDLARLNREGQVDPDSNYCFGEGGAGTYSDGKLYTRSNKRGDISRILHLFVHFGADERILYEAHPHIGTNKLPHIITAMREQLIACGAAVHFEKRVNDFLTEKGRVTGVTTSDGDVFKADACILATGHSARDIFQLLQNRNILVEAKPFALGVRAEHPQQLVDSIQYHCAVRPAGLPPSSYSLVQQVNNKGVFSFCMCPGGIIAPAATAAGEIVVNGWSPSRRDNPYANSGIVVQVEEKDIAPFVGQEAMKSPLRFLYFQQQVEQQCFTAGGGNLVAPAQRLVDFCNGKRSADLPGCSYHPGLRPVILKDVLPGFVYETLAGGFRAFGRKMKGYYTNDAVVVATESRTSSPVKIPRHPESLAHPQFENLYPCGEGAGYAGGIVSAAMDGEKVATQLSMQL